jgi:hypothetical protein
MTILSHLVVFCLGLLVSGLYFMRRVLPLIINSTIEATVNKVVEIQLAASDDFEPAEEAGDEPPSVHRDMLPHRKN